ncbi:hypothetical protein GCM10023219_21950 [Stakelama sediminis]|uniref:Outer membrane protein assembly factor BamE (Lipoprotein component of BamABCDE complex) n=1 Tax=Stakelama sediminis TaxID=463200 RepID=A0A840Z069_9SPHN|nr:outer membrane protein assembly factor BamE [Stakelama sediminis]MBB5719150.1 outer membrane protein assembly factor BamE (lipoprotein component of BamABCDE complex) [Stakelama sediminis]
MPVKSKPVLLAAIVLAAAATGGCAKVRAHHGYIFDQDLANSVEPGVDNQESVRAVMGDPTFTSMFNKGSQSEWFYISRITRNLAYKRPKPIAETVMRIRFAPDGTVASVDKTGLDQVVNINPTDKKTPTLGRKKSFFEQLFGNIGTVTPGGVGGAGGGGAGGGGQ